MGESQKVKSVWFPFTPFLSSFHRIPAKFDQGCLLSIHFQIELPESTFQLCTKTYSHMLVLEAQYHIISESNHYYIARCFPVPPIVCPQVKYIVEIDVGQQRTNTAALCKESYYAKKYIKIIVFSTFLLILLCIISKMII